MSSFVLENSDLKITNNKFTLTSGDDAIRQHLENRLRTFLGEWFLDIDLGVPYFRDILIKNPSFRVVSQVLKTAIIETPGVISLLYFKFEFLNQRQIDLIFTVQTETGEINFSEIIEV